MDIKSSEFRNKIMAMLAFFAAMFFVALYFLVAPAERFPSARLFEIREGDDLRKIAERLYMEGYIRSRSLFEFAVIAAGDAKRLQFGDYFFERPLSLIEVSRRVGKGIFGVESVKVTIPEGMNLWEIGAFFENLGMFTKEDLWQITGRPGIHYALAEGAPLLRDFSAETPLLLEKPRLTSLEGYLFPDTYFFMKNDSAEEVVEKMLTNLEWRITPVLREEMLRQNKTIHDVLTMASILEEEARTGEDRKLIAGILWKRMGANMLLQVDATLTYVIGKASLSLTNTDLRADSVYNTYRHKGLPLGPISNPGLASVEAALHPTPSPYWFYLSDKAGKLHYSKTHVEHRQKVQLYLR